MVYKILRPNTGILTRIVVNIYRPPTLILVKKFMKLGQILTYFYDILGHFGPNLYDIL